MADTGEDDSAMITKQEQREIISKLLDVDEVLQVRVLAQAAVLRVLLPDREWETRLVRAEEFVAEHLREQFASLREMLLPPIRGKQLPIGWETTVQQLLDSVEDVDQSND